MERPCFSHHTILKAHLLLHFIPGRIKSYKTLRQVPISLLEPFKLFLLVQLPVHRFKMEFHNVTHCDSTSCSGDTDRIGIAVGGVPHLRPDISDPTVSILSRNRAEAVTTYEPAIFPSCEKAFIRASATARLEGGRAKVLLTHAYITTNPAYDWAIKKLLESR